jgi:hypothetical protein
MTEYLYKDVKRHNNDILYMAYYFPQYHIAPENRIQLQTDKYHYTDWDVVKKNNKSLTPLNYYNLCDKDIFDLQDDRANKYGIGVFIFYHYWLDNSMILNLPIDFYIQKKRKTKFILCWDNQSGYLGKQYYDCPEKHAYQLIRYFKNENYLTDKNGIKPFLIYLTPGMDTMYLKRLLTFLSLHNINIKIGNNYQKYVNNWELPSWSEIACEFGPHNGDGPSRQNLYKYDIQQINLNSRCKSGIEYWQGIITSWDSRPRVNSLRTRQNKCSNDIPNGKVSPSGFGELVRDVKQNIHPVNKDKIITIFAWNEWAEGATLEESIEFGDEFIKCL